MKDAFTLVEMLVVVAVVMTLIALLLPVVLRDRRWARVMYCRENLHQIGLMYQAYAADYTDSFPPMIRGCPRYKGRTWYEGLLMDYGQREMRYDDLGSGLIRWKGKVGTRWMECPEYPCPEGPGYGQNQQIGFMCWWGHYTDGNGVRQCGGTRVFPSRFSQIPKHNIQILTTVSWGLSFSSAAYRHLGKDPHVGPSHPTPHFNRGFYWPNNWVLKPYWGKANFLFCDGHTETVSWDANHLTAENYVSWK
jgi:prepilin-type processing-associated H-X9-DG protein